VPKHWRISAALNGIVGALVALMMSVHIAAVLVTHVEHGWDFRLYGLLLFGAIGLTAGVLCVRSAVAMFSGNATAVVSGLRGSLIMIAVYAPVIPLQRIALGITLLALLNAVLLRNCHRGSVQSRQHAAGTQ
jgi:hypothetical protein